MIRPASLSDFASGTPGSLHSTLYGNDVMFDSVSIDSRTINKGDLFVAIRGDSFDGHQFVPDAIERGCCAVVVEQHEVETDSVNSLPTLVVDDTREMLGVIAQANREMFDGIVIGMTGSTGKTTTKNMLTAILSRQAPTCSTEGNLNNEIGVPLTLLSLQSHHKYAVVEMGARSKGDIHYLGQFVRPEVAVILNAGTAHIDVFGSYENIVSAKGELFEVLVEGGCAVLNADDPAASIWSAQLQGKKVIRFSMSKASAEVWAENTDCKEDVSTYTLRTENGCQDVSLPVPGHHNVVNSLAAAATAIAVGVDLESIALGLGEAKNDSGRLEFIRLPGNLLLIDDSYNANPASMNSALDVLSLREGIKVAVLGEMAELGSHAAEMHLKLAHYAGSKAIDSFYLTGPFAQEMAECIGVRAKVFSDKQALANQLCDECVSGESILVKGSRSAAMDDLVRMMESVMKGRVH